MSKLAESCIFLYIRPIRWYLLQTEARIMANNIYHKTEELEMVGMDLRDILSNLSRYQHRLISCLNSDHVIVNIDGIKDLMLHIIHEDNMTDELLTEHIYSLSRTYFPPVNRLVNPCKYSFVDLLSAAGKDENTDILYSLSQQHRNNEVKILCSEAGWSWQDMISEGITYTAFSPLTK